MLGIIDLIAALILLAAAYRIGIPREAAIIIIFLLAIKTLFSLASIGGLIDVSAVILLLMADFFVLPMWLLLIGAMMIGQKGIFSMFSID